VTLRRVWTLGDDDVATWEDPQAVGGAPLTVDVSSEQILGLHDSPVELIPALAGNAIVVTGVVIAYIAGETPYTPEESTLSVCMGGYSWASVDPVGFLDQDTDQVFFQGYGDLSLSGDTDAFADVPVQLVNSGPDYEDGDGTLKVTLVYAYAPIA
jgi:hypothetical protein